ncbi:hypothetical protein ACHAQH_009651 [Verticillium albo-atrum]
MFGQVLSIFMLLLSTLNTVHGTPVKATVNSTTVQHVIHGVNTKLIGPITISLVITSLVMALVAKYIKEHRAEFTAILTRKKRRTASVIALPPSPAAVRRRANTGDAPDDDNDSDIGDVTELIEMPTASKLPDADMVSLRAFLAETAPEPMGKGKGKGTDTAVMSGANGTGIGPKPDVKGKSKAEAAPAKGPRRVSWGKGLDGPTPKRPVHGSVRVPRRAPRREAPRPGESEAGPSGTHGREPKKETKNEPNTFVFW